VDDSEGVIVTFAYAPENWSYALTVTVIAANLADVNEAVALYEVAPAVRTLTAPLVADCAFEVKTTAVPPLISTLKVCSATTVAAAIENAPE